MDDHSADVMARSAAFTKAIRQTDLHRYMAARYPGSAHWDYLARADEALKAGIALMEAASVSDDYWLEFWEEAGRKRVSLVDRLAKQGALIFTPKADPSPAEVAKAAALKGQLLDEAMHLAWLGMARLKEVLA